MISESRVIEASEVDGGSKRHSCTIVPLSCFWFLMCWSTISHVKLSVSASVWVSVTCKIPGMGPPFWDPYRDPSKDLHLDPYWAGIRLFSICVFLSCLLWTSQNSFLNLFSYTCLKKSCLGLFEVFRGWLYIIWKSFLLKISVLYKICHLRLCLLWTCESQKFQVMFLK